MATPAALIGRINPRTGTAYGRTIHEGLDTRVLRDTAKKRDLLLGQIRREALEVSQGDIGSDASALAWAKRRQEHSYQDSAYEDTDPRTGEVTVFQDNIADDLIASEAERIAVRKGVKAAQRWHKIASAQAVAFVTAYEAYLTANKTLSNSTRNNLKTEVRRFLTFSSEHVTLQEVDHVMVYRYLNEFLPKQTSPKAPAGLRRTSIQRSQTLLSGVWRWARHSGLLSRHSENPWKDQLLTTPDDRRAAGPRENDEGIYTAEQWALLMQAVPEATPLGDTLRIAIMTGCRLEEIADLKGADVESNGSGFFVPKGKTKNARRYVPALGEAQAVIQRRKAGANDPLFFELPVRRSTGKRGGALSLAFTRVRRKVLGVETDDKLTLHSVRHTWRTMARRADVSERTVLELGGWSGQSTTDRPYDHGLQREGYRNAANKIISSMAEAGYFKNDKS